MSIKYIDCSVGTIVLIDNTKVRRVIEMTKTHFSILVRPEHALDGELETIPFKTKRNIEIITMAQAAKILTSKTS